MKTMIIDRDGSVASFSSFTQSCPTLWDTMDCSTPGFSVHRQFPELAQTHVYRVNDAIQPSHPLSSLPPASSPSQHQRLPVSQFFTSGGQSIGASASASVLPVNIQDWLPLGLTGSPCNSQEFSPTPQFKSINSSVLSFLHGPALTFIHDYWEKP